MNKTIDQLNLPEDEKYYLKSLELMGEEVEPAMNCNSRIIIAMARKLRKLEDDFKELEKQKQ